MSPKRKTDQTLILETRTFPATKSFPAVMLFLAVLSLLALMFFVEGCATYKAIEPPGRGSVLNPVRCDGPEGERSYLKRLRGPNDELVEYKYIDSILGPEGRILDIFSISNPAAGRRGDVMKAVGEAIVSDPEQPPAYRIYMDMYHPGVFDSEPIPGYKLIPLAGK